jgi:hypothetical protein
MTQTRISAPMTAVAVVAAAVALLLVALAPASAGAATITIKGKTDHGLRFGGDNEVKAGKNLKIVNDTNPKKVGPHTFTLAVKKDLPQKPKEFDACFAPHELCGTVGRAHKIDFEAETIGKINVESGKDGWDKLFEPDVFGDSHFFGGPETYKRKVTAKAGTTLTYFCLVHPFMQGSIKVK